MAEKRGIDTSVEGTLISLLESFGFPVYRQGSVTESYPENYFTFWGDEETGNAYYDNLTVGVRYKYSVYFYSIDPDNTYSYIHQARALLKQNGWTIQTRGYDVESDEQTHTGRGLDIVYLKHEID
jgi:hypothetical protein